MRSVLDRPVFAWARSGAVDDGIIDTIPVEVVSSVPPRGHSRYILDIDRPSKGWAQSLPGCVGPIHGVGGSPLTGHQWVRPTHAPWPSHFSRNSHTQITASPQMIGCIGPQGHRSGGRVEGGVRRGGSRGRDRTSASGSQGRSNLENKSAMMVGGNEPSTR